jgi:hypothetical protein
MALLAAQPAEKSAQQQFRVEAVSLCASMFARHRDARGVNDVSLNTACPQPTRQPEAITSGLISDNDALDLAPGLTGFIAPTMQELQQRRLVGIEPLEGLALDARDNRCNEPLRLAHLEQSRLGKLAMTSEKGPHAMVRLIARVVGVGVETADMLVNEVSRRSLRRPHGLPG